MIRLLKRTASTAVKLPFAMAWDLMSLGNMGEGASTTNLLREHKARKQVDDITEITEALSEIKKRVGK